MLLTDASLWACLQAGTLDVQPRPRRDEIQPASIDLHMGDEAAVFVRGAGQVVDLGEPFDADQHMARSKIGEAGLVLGPGQFALATTRERIRLGRNLAARVEGKSSLGRVGLAIHCTAGFIDPGFEGTITLELANLSPATLRLRPGMAICQLAVQAMSGFVERAYGEAGNHYQGQEGATPSRWKENPLGS